MKLKQFKRKNVIAFIKNNPVKMYDLLNMDKCLGTQFLKSLGHEKAQCLVSEFSLDNGEHYEYETPKWFPKLFDYGSIFYDKELIELIEG